jgi:hypothetical protein
MECSARTSFVLHANHTCHTAALEQDEIGWQNFAKGKISKHWGQLQVEYYHEIHSKQSMDCWTAGLVSHLLELIHGMWTHRNGIDHAVDEQGLPVHLVAEIETAIHNEFGKGMEGLA